MTFTLHKIVATSPVPSTSPENETDLISLIGQYVPDTTKKLIVQRWSKASESVDSALFSRYKKALEKVVKTPSFQTLHKKIAEKLVSLLSLNMVTLLADQELPPSVKELCVDRLPIMATILEKMLLRPTENLLLGTNGESHFKSYKETAIALKKALVGITEQSGITFEGRSLKLFAWCRQELSETQNPLVEVFLSHPRLDSSNRSELAKQFDTLNDISNLLILHIGACDDLADTIQDETLTKIIIDIPYANEDGISRLRTQCADHRGGIFLGYFDKVVDIWKDAIHQLEGLFGKDYFNTKVKTKFLTIFDTIVNSLNYSAHLNIRPHDPHITVPIIYETLAPNIMVCCFRYLEEALVTKFSETLGIDLPSQADLAILQEIINQSQSSAASSNAAATVSRELRENDLSSPFPFAINTTILETLKRSGETFVQIFENYLVSRGYSNGFFASYFEEKPSQKFDYLSLLELRRRVVIQIMLELHLFKAKGLVPPDSDYTIDAIGEFSVEIATQSSNENFFKGSFLLKYKRHLDLIDSFSNHLALETNVYTDFFKKWEGEIGVMRDLANTISDPKLKEETHRYINSWEEFLCMYLLFKRTFDGTI